jgi:hypothetical protein
MPLQDCLNKTAQDIRKGQLEQASRNRTTRTGQADRTDKHRCQYSTVRELMGRVRNVVLMNVYLGLENPGGSGFRVGGYMSQVREMEKLV